MSITEAYIKNIFRTPLWLLEKFAEQWMAVEAPDKVFILTTIIETKLERYEEEY